jgi:hypothetical protein
MTGVTRAELEQELEAFTAASKLRDLQLGQLKDIINESVGLFNTLMLLHNETFKLQQATIDELIRRVKALESPEKDDQHRWRKPSGSPHGIS